MKFSKNELSSHSLNPFFHRLLTELHTRQCQYSRKKQEPYIQLTCITFMCADMTCSHKTLKFDLSKSRERDIHTHTWKLNYSLFLKDDFVFSDQTMLKTRSIQWGYNPGITGRHGGEITIVLTFFSYIGLWYAPLWSSPVQQASENRWRERGEESSLQVYYICQALACRKRTSIWACQHSGHIIVSCWFVLWILVERCHLEGWPKSRRYCWPDGDTTNWGMGPVHLVSRLVQGHFQLNCQAWWGDHYNWGDPSKSRRHISLRP